MLLRASAKYFKNVLSLNRQKPFIESIYGLSTAAMPKPEPPASDITEVVKEELRLMQEADDLTPRGIVEQLDRFIVGQSEAKRAVAIALRNRYFYSLI